MRLEDEAKRARRTRRVPPREPRGDEPPPRVQGRLAGCLCRRSPTPSPSRGGSGRSTTTSGSSSAARRQARPRRPATRGWRAIRPGFSSTSRRSGPAANTDAGCGRTRSSPPRAGPPSCTRASSMDMAARSTTSTAPRRGTSRRGTTPRRRWSRRRSFRRSARCPRPSRPRSPSCSASRRRSRRAHRRAITSRASSSSNSRRCSPSASRRCSSPRGPSGSAGSRNWPDTPETAATRRSHRSSSRFGVERFVTGHTPSQSGRIVSRFNNRLILIDTGMVFKSGRASALELHGGRITAIYTDSRTPIVAAGAGYLPREAVRGFAVDERFEANGENGFDTWRHGADRRRTERRGRDTACARLGGRRIERHEHSCRCRECSDVLRNPSLSASPDAGQRPALRPAQCRRSRGCCSLRASPFASFLRGEPVASVPSGAHLESQHHLVVTALSRQAERVERLSAEHAQAGASPDRGRPPRTPRPRRAPVSAMSCSTLASKSLRTRVRT